VIYFSDGMDHKSTLLCDNRGDVPYIDRELNSVCSL